VYDDNNGPEFISKALFADLAVFKDLFSGLLAMKQKRDWQFPVSTKKATIFSLV